jgi:hypothetical protein
VGVFEAGEGQTEVIEALVERLAGDGDGEIGEVGQSHAARRTLLAENHLAIHAIHRPLGPDASLQGSPHPSEKPGMSIARIGRRPLSRKATRKARAVAKWGGAMA